MLRSYMRPASGQYQLEEHGFDLQSNKQETRNSAERENEEYTGKYKAASNNDCNAKNINDEEAEPPISSTYKTTALRFPEAHESAFEPKVQIPYTHQRGRVPRKIEIERRRRFFESHNLLHLIEVSGLTLQGIAEHTNTTLPLEIFDDTSYEARNPAEWIAIARNTDNEASKFLPAEGIYYDADHNSFTIKPCRVIDWDVAKNALHIKWGAASSKHNKNNDRNITSITSSSSNNSKNEVNSSRPENSNDKGGDNDNDDDVVYTVPRIMVRLLAEDPLVYVQRLVNAQREREKVMKWVMYRLCCDSMPVDGLDGLDDLRVQRLRTLATCIPQLSESAYPQVQHEVDRLLQEMELVWKRSHNEILLQDRMKHDESVRRLVQSTTQITYEELMHGPNMSIVRSTLADPRSVIEIDGVDIAEQQRAFTFATYFTQPEVVQALTAVHRECLTVMTTLLFDIPKERQMSLETFSQRQVTKMQQVTSYLKNEWLQNICNVIKRCFQTAGKGWLNVNESKQSVYEVSKLKKFFNTVKFMMEDTIFELVYNSLTSFTTFFEEVSDFTVNVIDRNTVHNAWPGSEADDCVEKQPLFTINLIEQDDRFSYSVSFSDFEAAIVNLFNSAISCTEALPQVERYVMSQYFWRRDGDGPFLHSVTIDEERVRSLRSRLQVAIQNSLKPLALYLEMYDELLPLIRLNKQEFIDDYAQEEHTIDEMRSEIVKHLKAKKVVAEHIPLFLTVGNYVVNCQSFSFIMSKKEEDLAKLVMQLISKLAKRQSQTIREEFNKIVRVMEKQPQTPEKLYELYAFMDGLNEKVGELTETINEMRQYYALLDTFQFDLTDDESRQKWEAIAWPRQLTIRKHIVRKQLEEVQDELHSRLQKEQEEFAKKVEQLQRVVATFSRYTDAAEADKVAAEVKTRNIELRQCIEQARAINADQRLFGDKLTDYRNVFELDKEFKPYSDLWLTTYNWQESYRRWHADAFDTLDAEEIESTVTTAFKTMTSLSKTFKDKTATLKIVEEIRAAVEQFKPWVPIVTSLRHPGMKHRHWLGLSEKLQMKLMPGETIMLLDDCEMLLAHKDGVVSFCEVAAKESQIERSLIDMRAKWETKLFIVESYKETGTYILKDTSEIIEILDEHLNLTQQLQFSPFKTYFEESINDWERSLNLISDIIEQWMECQRAWRYLEPIFSSDDIAMQLPRLSKVFEKVDKIWRRIMGNVHSKPNVLEYCLSASKLLDNLREANRLLEEVQRGLNDYLADKRQTFPRFYFLSDEELLEILSQAKEVRRIDSNIAKLFEFISKLEWNEQNQIIGFWSAENEHVGAMEAVTPEGNIEVWLRTVEAMMKEAVHAQIRMAYEDYLQHPRSEWVLAWPAQVVIAVALIYWTQGCEEALAQHGRVDDFDALLEKQLYELVDVVQSPLSAMQQINMGALITIEVHAKDTIAAMARQGVSSMNAFEWMRQLRFYFDQTDKMCHVRQVDAHFVYGGEYLGNTGRLVVTPLTDRIYLTLTGALALCLGGAPAGPAGTGKTETTKDLAKALAKQCVVFNCQEGMTYLSMAKFFKGLAWTGAWACFDEFNRIDVEVLSVVAQQVTDLQQACITKQYRITFEESDLIVDPTHAVFITMNPGYAGRTELPDNLKVLFRPVACMVPDYAMIAEIRLFSYGYKKARALAQKMVMTFKLSSEQLSSQDHYDFGMRAVNTVISAAGLNKRECPDEDEDVLLLRALRDSNVPKFLKDDVILFEGIISDLFPGVELKETEYGVLVRALEECVRAMHLEPIPAFIHKCLQLYDVTTLRHGLMLVSPAGGGKTTAYTSLQQALSLCAERQSGSAKVGIHGNKNSKAESVITKKAARNNNGTTDKDNNTTTNTTTDSATANNDNNIDGDNASGTDKTANKGVQREYKKVYTHICNPKAVTMDQLYGAYDENGEWKDGILCILFRRAAKYGDEGNLIGKHWVLFDGPVDALWIESMNTVLDENKKLCLVSGEIIQMNRDMTMMFEVEDLAVASPATVSRCGMIYLDPVTCVPISASITTWINALPIYMNTLRSSLHELADTYLAEIIHFVRQHTREYVQSTNSGLTYSFFRMMNGFVKSFEGPKMPPGQPPIAPERLEAITTCLTPLFFFSLIWSVGASCDEDGRERFSDKLRTLAQSHNHQMHLPDESNKESCSVYDYCYQYNLNASSDSDEVGAEAGKVGWLHWNELATPLQPSHSTRYEDIIVPTIDNIRQNYVLRHLLMEKINVAAIGPTGTGKSVAVSRLILGAGGALPSSFLGLTFTFSAQTKANVLQNSLMAKFDKRRSHVYGAPTGKHFLIFIDDANLPQKEKYGAQPPLELLRQLLGHGGFYSITGGIKWNSIIDTSLVLAMGPPGGGRSTLSNRFMRFFNFVTFPEMSEQSKRDIITALLKIGFIQRGVVDEVRQFSSALIESTLRVFKFACRTFLPTPAHVHYSFNMRDIIRVFPMIYQIDAKCIPTCEALTTLWLHETQRVFADRLINEDDKGQLTEFLRNEVQELKLGSDYDALIHADRLIYGDFFALNGSYEQVTDMEVLSNRFNDLLATYNDENETRMNLVLFLDAIEHVCRIARVLRMPNGHCLLLGIGGSGRKSLTRLACSLIPEMEVFTVEITKNFGIKEWHESLSKLLLDCGKNDKKRTFLFTDTQLIHSTFMEEVASLLTSGDIPNLFEEQDIELINDKFRGVCISENLPTTKVSVYARFTKEVRANLHVVLAFSPIGEVFRTRMRMFPALIACCTIDWFAEWPAEALLSVAAAELSESEIFGNTNASIASKRRRSSMLVKKVRHSITDKRGSIVSMTSVSGSEVMDMEIILADCFKSFHLSATEITEKFFAETRRRSYVTPTSYLSLLHTFQQMLTTKRKFIHEQRSRLENGLEKLRDTEERVSELEAQLKAQQPVLAQKKEEIRVIMERLAVDRKDAALKEADAREEENAASLKAEECAAMRRECANRLAEAEPALAEAVKVLSKIKSAEITELNKYQNPPKGVQYVMEAVALLLTFGNCPKEFYSGPAGGKKLPDWWLCAKSYMRDANKLLELLVQPYEKGGFNREAMDMSLIEKVKAYYENDEFQPEKVRSVSVPCMAMCLWVRAMYKWFFVNREIQPLRERLASAEDELNKVTNALRETRALLDRVIAAVAMLEKQYTDAMETQTKLENEMERTSLKLHRASRLIDGLGGEKARWLILVQQYKQQEGCVIGDMLIAAATVAYCGPLTSEYRRALHEKWMEQLRLARITCSERVGLVDTCGDAVQIQEWQLCELPTDALSTENAIILTNARTWPLLIDPQGQANTWIRNIHKNDNLQICKASSERFMKTIENAIRLGLPCLLENVGETLDASLEPVLMQNVFMIGSTPHIRIGDSAIPYDRNFKLYMTTKLPNPSYTPETIVLVSLLNFFITPSGLEEQLLGKAVEKERNDLEAEKQKLTRDNAEKNRDLKEMQENILRMLEAVEGDILEQEELITTLERSKAKSAEINADLLKAKETEEIIDETRNKYRLHASRGSLLFFCVAQLSLVDPMYEFSLQWFFNLFVSAIAHTQRGDESEKVEQRVQNLIDYLTFSFYSNVCRSLFEKHKLTFSFHLCTRIIAQRRELDDLEFRYLLTGPTGHVTSIPNPATDWLTEESWNEINFISVHLPAFSGFAEHVAANITHYRALFDSNEAHSYPLASPWSEKETPLQRLIITRCLRKDKVGPATQNFVRLYIGERFIIAPQFNLLDAYNDSDCLTPLVFINSQGSDPMNDLLRFAETMKMSKKLDKVSLGQGQGKKAEELIASGRDKGQWVLLQNCHLATSWMSTLEAIVESFTVETVKKEFRLWLTSMPCASFPVSVLQIAVKMTNEPPMGLRANVTRSYFGFTESDLEHEDKPKEYKALLFSLCLFHGVIQERRKFGSLGFNIPYEFNDSDRNVCMMQLRKFLSLYDTVPFDVLTFLTGEINYGGRVTDDWDRRCMMTLITHFMQDRVLDNGYCFSPSGAYHTIAPGNRTAYLNELSHWPINPLPEVFGLHENADITCAQNTTQSILSTILSLVSRGTTTTTTTSSVSTSTTTDNNKNDKSDAAAVTAAGSSGESTSKEAFLLKTAEDIHDKVPASLNVSEFMAKYPTCYEESMNTVLVQEAMRYNRLLEFIHTSLAEFVKAIRGEVALSAELEAMGASFDINTVPSTWNALAYPSLKPLSSWVDDLAKRVEFIYDWYEHGVPSVFWIGGFFFPQAFLTGTLQNYARQTHAAIDTISFGFEIQKPFITAQNVVRPEKGAMIYGLFMEGARWDANTHSLTESRPKELYTEMPLIHLDPIINRKVNSHDYVCPVYKTLTRAGTLSTTGHSTNFVLPIEIPTKIEPSHWIERGVACIVSLNF